MTTTTYAIVPADLQEQQVAVMHAHVALSEIPGFLATAFAKTPRVSAAQGLRVAGPPFARYHVHSDGSFDIEAGFPVSGRLAHSEGVEPGTLPAGHVVTTVHVGRYDDVGRAYEALEVYLSKNGFEPAGEGWECYLDDPHVPEPRTKVYLPARRLSRRG